MTSVAQGKRLRVAYIVGAFPNLSETFIAKQIDGVAQRGHAVDVYTTCAAPAQPTAATPAGVSIHRLYASPNRLFAMGQVMALLLRCGWRAPQLVARVWRTMRQEGVAGSLRLLYAGLTLHTRGQPAYDAIHAQFGPFGLFALQLSELGVLRGPIVTSFRGYDAGKHLRVNATEYQRLFRQGALFLPVSRTLAARLIAAGCPATKVRVHHSGLAVTQLRYRERRIPPAGEVRLITVARLVEKKGIAYAIEAVARLLASGRRVSYTVVGGGPLQQELERLVQRHRATGSIRLVGAKSHAETLRLLDSSHILIAPSVTAGDGDEEGIPNAAKEAMALGLPVVATRHGGIPELIDDGHCGWLVPERDVTALAARLQLLVDYPHTWSTATCAARVRVEALFDSERLSDELVELYASLAHAKDSRPLKLDTGRQPASMTIRRA